MTRSASVARATAGRAHDVSGMVTLEWVLALPLLLLAVLGMLEVAAVVRDALLVQDAARVGVRAAATSTGTGDVEAEVARALAGRPHTVSVAPRRRGDGDLVEVTVSLERALGPVTHRLQATAHARVEPSVGAAGPPP